MSSIIAAGSPLSGAILQLFVVTAASSLVFVVGRILADIYRADQAYKEFRRQTNGLTMASGRNVICNHTLNLLQKNSMKISLLGCERHGEKTVGWLHHDKFCASTIDPELMKRIVLDQPSRNINKIDIGGPAVEFMEDTIMIAKDEQWRRLRRAVAPALRSNKFKAPNVVHEIESSISKLIEAIEGKLSASSDKPEQQVATIEADELLHRFTLDVVFRCFYKQHDLIDYSAPHCRWVELVDEGLNGFKHFIFQAGLMVKALCKPVDWILMSFSRQGRWRNELIDFIQRQTELSLRARKELEERRKQGIKVDVDDFELSDGTRFKRNLADHITDHLLDGKITRREYFNTTGFLITAGDKTVVDSLVYTLYRLAIDPEGVQWKLRRSIEEGGTDSVFLDWVISESLRLMPPAPVSCSRTTADEIQLDGGKRLPAGTFVDYPGYIVHRLKEYWGEDANEFKPERWHDTSHHHPLQYVPFGAGVRQCPGREFALFEMKQLLAKLLLRYEFHCDPKADIDEFYVPFTIFLLPDSPTFIKITRLPLAQ